MAMTPHTVDLPSDRAPHSSIPDEWIDPPSHNRDGNDPTHRGPHRTGRAFVKNQMSGESHHIINKIGITPHTQDQPSRAASVETDRQRWKESTSTTQNATTD